jgi:integrase
VLTGMGGTVPHKRLTETLVKRVKAEPGAERSVYWDAGQPGFGLMVTSGGHRSFVVQYRAHGVSRRMTLPAELSLKDARREARALLGNVAKGHDPLAERRKKAAEATNTLRSIAEEYLSREGGRLRTMAERRAVFERLVYPKLGARQIDTIKRSEINRLLDKIEDESGASMADHTLAYLRRLFNWHASRSDDFRTPIVRGMARTSNKERERARILSDEELRAIWRVAEGATGPFGTFVQFLVLTGARRSEAAGMTWSEITNGDWTLPAARNKVKQDLIRPLSPAAQAVLAKLPRHGTRGLVFTTDGKHPIGGFSKFKAAFDRACGITGWTIHDLRRTARSLMSRAGVAADHAERALGHVIGGVRGVYDRHEFKDEKRRAFEALAAQIERIVNPQENVVPLRESARS